jgi:hypothetical protein
VKEVDPQEALAWLSERSAESDSAGYSVMPGPTPTTSARSSEALSAQPDHDSGWSHHRAVELALFTRCTQPLSTADSAWSHISRLWAQGPKVHDQLGFPGKRLA